MTIFVTLFRELLLAATLGVVLVPAASLTGQGERLCEAIGGTWDVTAPDQCKGGTWRELARGAPWVM